MIRSVLAAALVLSACRGDVPAPAPSPRTAPRVDVPRPFDLVRIPAGPFVRMSTRCAPGRTDLRPDGRTDKTVEGRAFLIDRRVATYEDYAACVRAGRCPSVAVLDYWMDRVNGVVVTTMTPGARDLATAYCQWRGMRLPSYAELQRAFRGANGRSPPDASDVKGDCQDDGRGCFYVTPSGLAYRNRLYGAEEWTRDDDCRWDADGLLRTAPLALALDPRLHEFGDPIAGNASIRCVIDTEDPPDGG